MDNSNNPNSTNNSNPFASSFGVPPQPNNPPSAWPPAATATSQPESTFNAPLTTPDWPSELNPAPSQPEPVLPSPTNPSWPTVNNNQNQSEITSEVPITPEPTTVPSPIPEISSTNQPAPASTSWSTTSIPEQNNATHWAIPTEAMPAVPEPTLTTPSASQPITSLSDNPSSLPDPYPPQDQPNLVSPIQSPTTSIQQNFAPDQSVVQQNSVTPQPELTASMPTPIAEPPSTLPSSPMAPTADQSTNPSLSPLDNPWGVSTQPPSINVNAPSDSQPTWQMSTNPTNTQEPLNPNVNTTINHSVTEAAPTDLSHLITNNDSQLANPQPTENLITTTSPNPTPEVPSIPTQHSQGIPKWLIGVGVGLLLVVIGASAYFILGIGQPAKETTSLPATVATDNQLKQTAPIATPVANVQPSEQPIASGSSNFGELGGSAGTTQATSAAELLRQRQQQAR